MYYFGIKRPDPLIYGREERYATDINQTNLMPPIELLEQTQYLVRILTSRLEQLLIIPKGVLVQ
jgi:hypothetical protein